MHENIKKNIFIKLVFVAIGINRDMVLKWKLGHLVQMDFLLLKRFSFSSTPPLIYSTVLSLGI